MASELAEVFGERLHRPGGGDSWQLETPQSLHGKVVVKGKRCPAASSRPSSALGSFGSSIDFDSDEESDTEGQAEYSLRLCRGSADEPERTSSLGRAAPPALAQTVAVGSPRVGRVRGASAPRRSGTFVDPSPTLPGTFREPPCRLLHPSTERQLGRLAGDARGAISAPPGRSRLLSGDLPASSRLLPLWQVRQASSVQFDLGEVAEAAAATADAPTLPPVAKESSWNVGAGLERAGAGLMAGLDLLIPSIKGQGSSSTSVRAVVSGRGRRRRRRSSTRPSKGSELRLLRLGPSIRNRSHPS